MQHRIISIDALIHTKQLLHLRCIVYVHSPFFFFLFFFFDFGKRSEKIYRSLGLDIRASECICGESRLHEIPTVHLILQFGFEGNFLIPIVPVPAYCLSFTSLRERLRTHKVFTKDQCFTFIIVSSP